MFTSDDQPGWLMDSNNICHPSPDNKIKCSYFDYVQLLMNGQAGQWTWTPSTTPLQPKKWNASFLDYAQLLMIGWTEWWTQTPSTIPLHPKKMKCSFLDYIQLLMIGRAGWWTQTPSAAPLQPIKRNAYFWITFNFWWSAGLVNGLKPHLPPLSSQKNEMLIFWLCSTSDDWPGWLMDSNPICHPSPAKKMKCSYFDYVQLLMISRAALWTQTHLPPLSCQKMKWLFLDYIQLLMISWAARWTWTRSTPHLQPKNWNSHILIMFNFWW